jgi:hypothetical protein
MAEARKVKTGVGDDGEPTYEYQLGADVGGVFVPFVTKSAGYVEHLIERGRASQEQERSGETLEELESDE